MRGYSNTETPALQGKKRPVSFRGIRPPFGFVAVLLRQRCEFASRFGHVDPLVRPRKLIEPVSPAQQFRNRHFLARFNHRLKAPHAPAVRATR